MAGETAALARLARLRAEIDVDLGALDARLREAAALAATAEEQGTLPRAELVLLAVNLHGWYTALETLLERVARLLDEDVPAGPTWHVDLLSQMTVTIPAVRPALLPRAVVDDLHELRKFRHFFRNAYVLELDPARVRAVAARATRAHPLVWTGIAGLRAHLDATIAELAGSG